MALSLKTKLARKMDRAWLAWIKEQETRGESAYVRDAIRTVFAPIAAEMLAKEKK